METETKQRQDINQGNATAWQTANNTTRKQNKRETEISVRRESALVFSALNQIAGNEENSKRVRKGHFKEDKCT